MVTYQSIFKLILKHCKSKAIVSLVVLTLITVFPSAEIYVFNHLIGQISLGWNYGIIVDVISYLLLFLFLPQLSMAVYRYCSNSIKCKLDVILASDALKKTLNVSVTDIESGEGVNTAYRASQTQNNGIAQIFFDFIELIMIIMQFVIFAVSLRLIGILAAMIGALLILGVYRWKHALSNESIQFYWALDEEKRYIEMIYGMLLNREYACEICQYETQDWLFCEYETRKTKTNQKEYEFEKQMKKSGCKIDYIQAIACAGVILLSCLLVHYGFITAAWGITYIYASDKWINFVGKIVDKLNQYSIKKLSMTEYNKQIGKKDECGENQVRAEDIFPLEVQHLKYRYQNSVRDVLNGVELQIHKGEKVVLVGVNGSGKSTLIRLLMGFDMAKEGTVIYDGIPIEQCMECVRDCTTIMQQKFFKYNMTLGENIIVSDYENRNSHLLDHAVQWAELEGIIGKLRSKLDTEIIQGNQLSGGEWQKIALGRLKFRDRPFIVMDEPNAAVDASYEIGLYKKLMELGNGKTMFIVSHRLPICQLADKIIVMEKGKVVEVGTHKELMSVENGVYRHLFESQAELYADGDVI